MIIPSQLTPIPRLIAHAGQMLLVAAVLLTGCKKSESPTEPVSIPPWDTGQSAEGVLGQSDLVSTGVKSIGQSSTNKPWGLAISTDGTLFVVDQLLADRVVRFNSAPTKANGANADGVLGHANFTDSLRNYSGASTPNAQGFETPTSVALDAAGNLYVVDQNNDRVLRFNAAASKANGASADAVFGQQDFVTEGFDVTASTLFGPEAVTVDPSGNLYIADGFNNRVVRYNNAASKGNGADADGVLGQASFTVNTKGTTAAVMDHPSCVAVDKSGNLYVGERGNHRVLVFLNAASKANGASADIVLGQSTFTDGTAPAGATASTINNPYGLAVDDNYNLYVADGGYNRVLIFYNAPSKSSGADGDAVLGKKDFTSSATTNAAPDNIGQPYGVAVHSASGMLFVSGYSNSRILRFKAKSDLHP